MMRRQLSWCAAAMILAVTPALAAPAPSPQLGTLNYVEGQASVNGQPVNPKSANSEVVTQGAVLSTGAGKAEMLLTPGVFLRLGENSQLRMVNAGLADTELALVNGQATIEADYFSKDNHLTVEEGMASTAILKRGLYVLSTDQPFVKVLDGEAKVTVGLQHETVGKNREAVLNGSQKLKTQDFNPKLAEDASLVRWSRLRSAYEAQANIDAAQTMVVNNGWYGPGWYWDPGYYAWSFLPGDGILYSPWGYGFYSPFVVSYYPGFYGGGFYGGFRGGFAGGGFRGGFGRR